MTGWRHGEGDKGDQEGLQGSDLCTEMRMRGGCQPCHNLGTQAFWAKERAIAKILRREWTQKNVLLFLLFPLLLVILLSGGVEKLNILFFFFKLVF